MSVPNNNPEDAKRQELEDEMSRFEKEISGHTIDRPIIGTNTFQQASQTIQDVHSSGPDANSTNFGHFHPQNAHPMQNFPAGHGMPPPNMPANNPPMNNLPMNNMPVNNLPMNNMPMDNMAFHQHPVPQLPMQRVPMQPQLPQFHHGMPQVIQNVVPMVPVGIPVMPANVTGNIPARNEHSITPEEKKEWESAYAKKDNDAGGGKAKKKDKKCVRVAGGFVWEDPSLAEWDPNDFRIFVGDLGNEVTDETLTRAFSKYPSFQKAKVIRERKTNKTKGYGFVSFKESGDFIKAMREMNGKYVGNRPIKLRKSTWKDRSIDIVKKKVKEKKKLGLR